MTALYIRLHNWRGFSLFNPEPDLFHHVWRLGFVSIYVCRQCLLNAYRKLRSTLEQMHRELDDNGR